MDVIARRAPSGREGAGQSVAHRTVRSTPIWRQSSEPREGRRMVKSGRMVKSPVTSRGHREIPFRALGSHKKPRAFGAEFGIVHTSSELWARISTVFSSVGHYLGLPRTSASSVAMRCVLRRLHSATKRLDIFRVFAALFIVKRLAYCLIWY